MKSPLIQISIFAVLLALLSSCSTTGYVSTVPESPTYVETTPPYTGAVWISPEYTWRHDRYEVVAGHWEHAKHGRSWTPGHWEHTDNGHRWERGRWR